MNKNLSVIVPSYNGENKLPNLLESLESQDYKNFEVIVVVDGSTDNTQKVIESNKWRLDLRIIYQINKGRSGARNIGAHNANGELLVFFDDDMVMQNNAIQKHLDHHSKYPEGILIGNTELKVDSNSNEFEVFKSSLDKRWYSNLPDYGTPLTHENLFLTAANFSISRSVFRKLKGFKESLSDLEDMEFAKRAMNKEVNIYVNKSIYGWHIDKFTFRGYIKRRREYNRAAAKLNIVKKEIEVIKYVKKITYSAFANQPVLRLCEQNKLSFLPLNLRFKIYELLVWGYSNYFMSRNI